jgi:hypothetical protein
LRRVAYRACVDLIHHTYDLLAHNCRSLPSPASYVNSRSHLRRLTAAPPDQPTYRGFQDHGSTRAWDVLLP